MKFEIVRGSKIGNAKERYFINDRSVDCNPTQPNIFDILRYFNVQRSVFC